MVKATFVELLAQSSATLPTSDAEITAFLSAHQVKFSSGASSAMASKRKEIAAGVMWLQTLSVEDDTDVTAVESLPSLLKKAICSAFDLKSNASTDGWNKLAIRRAHAFMLGGSSPAKKKRPDADRGDGRSASSSSARRRHDEGATRSRGRRDSDRHQPRDRDHNRDRGSGRSRSQERDHNRRHPRSSRSDSHGRGGRSSGRDRSQEPFSSTDYDSVASDSEASEHSGAEARRGSRARASRASPTRGPRISKRSSGSSTHRSTDDSGSDRGARASRRHQRPGYDSDGGGRAREDRRRPRRDRSSSPEPEVRRRRKNRKSCRSDSDSARSKDTDDSSDPDSDAASDRSLTPEPRGTKGRGVAFGSKGVHASSSGRLARGSDQGSKRQPLLDLQASDSSEVLRLCAREWLRGARLQGALPPRWLVNLCCCISWPVKKKRSYEKARREARASSELRCEDPLEPAWAHRIAFLYTSDSSMSTDAANLARVAKGETLALYEVGLATDFEQRQHYLAFLRELKAKWEECLSSLQSGYNLSEVEKNGFSTWYLQGFERRFQLMKRELGFATREALEVLANSARQLSEIRTFLASFWSDLASLASVLNRDDQAEFYRARFEVVFTPSVEVFLGTAGARAGPGTFGPTSAGATSVAEAAGSAASCRTSGLSQADGCMPTAVRPPRISTKQPAAAAASPAATPAAGGPGPGMNPLPLYAGPPFAWPYPPPGQFTFGAGPSVPALPPPPYAPPQIKQEPSQASGGRPSKQVQFSLPASTPATAAPSTGGKGPTGPSVPSADGLDSFYPPGGAFVALPAHAYVVGPRAVRALPVGPFGPVCHCRRVGDPASTAHATWDCPLRFWSVRGKCPGFLQDGRRDPAAWVGEEITDATRAQWKEFGSTLRKSRAAPGVPSFD